MATFRLFGDGRGLTAAAVTDRLGIRPSKAHEAGTRTGPGTSRLREVSGWHLSSADGPESDVEPHEQLHRVLDILEPAARRLWELVAAGYEADWFCYLGSYGTEHAAVLDRDTMRRLLALPGDLLIDNYDDAPES